MEKWATISDCGNYRYVLGRRWGAGGKRIVWVMLNPSTADAEVDDATIKTCISFSKVWGADELTVVNLFAYRSTDPKALREVNSPIGPKNHAYIAKEACHPNATIVAGWGNHGTLHARAHAVLGWELFGKQIFCLGKTKTGQPWHPLYRSLKLPLLPY